MGNDIPPPGWGSRHWVILMLFLGTANTYVMRFTMSVAIDGMVNQSAIEECFSTLNYECQPNNRSVDFTAEDGPYIWSPTLQGYVFSSFLYGNLITQIPFGMIAKWYDARVLMSWGMIVNSLCGLAVPVAAAYGEGWLIACRFIQGLGEGSMVPCTHAILAKWIPPKERSRLGTAVFAGAQFGTVISMSVSGLIAEIGFRGLWTSTFYFFGLLGTIWSLFFMVTVTEDPELAPRILQSEKNYIVKSLWAGAGSSLPPTPWSKILRSMPFWAIMLVHIGQNYGYETLMTGLPTFMREVLDYPINKNGLVSALPNLCMLLFSIFISFVADKMVSSGTFNPTQTRKIFNSIGVYGPAIGLFIAAHTRHNVYASIVILAIGFGFNGGIYSGFMINHIEIAPRFASILMSLSYFTANIAGLLAPTVAVYIIDGNPTQERWRIVFGIAGFIYCFSSIFYVIYGSSQRQEWDDPTKDAALARRRAAKRQMIKGSAFEVFRIASALFP